MDVTRRPLAPVLVPVDRLGSPTSVQYAARESVRSGRPLHLVHVAPVADAWRGEVGHEALRVALARATSVLTDRVPVTGTLERGSVIPELARHGAGAALVVLEHLPPSLERTPSTRTTTALANVLDAPILVVPHDWVESSRRVVTLGLEPGAVDVNAVRDALAVARLRGSVLRVLVSGDLSRERVTAILDQLGGDACDLAVEIVDEDPADALLRAAATSDLLVLGRRRTIRPEGSRLGPVTTRVLDELVCPVLLSAPGHVHDPGPARAGDRQETEMYARPGDRIVIRSGMLGAPVRDGEILEVGREDGGPPYRVRWSDDGHVSLFFPGPDAYIDRPSVTVT